MAFLVVGIQTAQSESLDLTGERIKSIVALLKSNSSCYKYIGKTGHYFNERNLS